MQLKVKCECCKKSVKLTEDVKTFEGILCLSCQYELNRKGEF